MKDQKNMPEDSTDVAQKEKFAKELSDILLGNFSVDEEETDLSNVKENILFALGGGYGEAPDLPEVGESYDGDYKVILCPVCGNKALDDYGICCHCGWEYDGSPEDLFSACNGASLAEYRRQYKLLTEASGGTQLQH